MQLTEHAGIRMSQRGIPRRLIDFALRHGRIEGDKFVLDRQESQRVIAALNEELRLAKRVLDKGGVTVVGAGGRVLTTYNVNEPFRRSREKRHD